MGLAVAGLSTQLLVIGGGATGLGVAWDACLRGLKVVLIEQGDLGQGTSGRYHGLLHSGGRYVVSDPPSARDCALENQVLRNLAPQTIEDTGGLFAAAPADPAHFAEDWKAGADAAGVPYEEMSVAEALRTEPLLNPRLTRVFRVQDAALDSFDLLHSLVRAIRSAGGQVWLRHRLESFLVDDGRVRGARVRSLASGEVTTVGSELVINAAGPWAGKVAAAAGIRLPIALGKGTMLAMASRLVHTVINRLKPPSDGDIIVPVGTVAVLGTTDVPIQEPEDLAIEPWEIDLLIAEGEILIPDLSHHRALRAWAGVRPLWRPEAASEATRELPRAHQILDHEEKPGVKGIISVIGGKLTTFRLMAEQAVDLASRRLGVSAPCLTHQTPLEKPGTAYFALPARWERIDAHKAEPTPAEIVCECEAVQRDDLLKALAGADTVELDDVRRDLRLGMGPCQGAFCAYRAAGIAQTTAPDGRSLSWLLQFLSERWRGIRPLGWGPGLRQMELTRRIYLELLGAALPDEERR
jgi:glycerol-3-phosphate dehydrogenase